MSKDSSNTSSNYRKLSDKPTPYVLSENDRRLMKDKVTENPGTIQYAHHSGSALIKPEDKGKLKGLAVSAMHEQTDAQLGLIQEQVELLMRQATEIKSRVEISERIYLAEFKNKPLIGKTYHLYEKKDGSDGVSLIGPKEWGRSFPYEKFLASVKLLSDHTWEIIDGNISQ